MLAVDTRPFRRPEDPPWREGDETPLDWSGRLSIDMVRQHTKTDDNPGVDDDQLRLYRASAVEAAERYTGLLLSAQKTITEVAEGPAYPRKGMTRYKLRLKYPTADGLIYFYGGLYGNDNMRLQVPIGTRTLTLPVRYTGIDLTNCCDPCAKSNTNINSGMMVMYKAGFSSPDAVPSLVVLGCLQYIAWVVQHPGDEILTVRNRRDARSEGAQGTNNISIASGALETWRLLDEDIT